MIMETRSLTPDTHGIIFRDGTPLEIGTSGNKRKPNRFLHLKITDEDSRFTHTFPQHQSIVSDFDQIIGGFVNRQAGDVSFRAVREKG